MAIVNVSLWTTIMTKNYEWHIMNDNCELHIMNDIEHLCHKLDGSLVTTSITKAE